MYIVWLFGGVIKNNQQLLPLMSWRFWKMSKGRGDCGNVYFTPNNTKLKIQSKENYKERAFVRIPDPFIKFNFAEWMNEWIWLKHTFKLKNGLLTSRKKMIEEICHCQNRIKFSHSACEKSKCKHRSEICVLTVEKKKHVDGILRVHVEVGSKAGRGVGPDAWR